MNIDQQYTDLLAVVTNMTAERKELIKTAVQLQENLKVTTAHAKQMEKHLNELKEEIETLKKQQKEEGYGDTGDDANGDAGKH